MRILLVNRFYGSSQTPTARMAEDVVRVLTKDGHAVTVLTTRSAYTESGRAPEERSTAKVRYIFSLSERFRVVNWGLFLLQACILLPVLRWDRCLLLTDPPFLLSAGFLAKMLRRRREVYLWTMDLYPEALRADGVIGARSFLYLLFAGINELGMRYLRGIICLDSMQLKRLREYRAWRTTRPDYTIIPPWDLRPIKKVSKKDNRFVRKLGLKSKRIALYAGNLGKAHSHHQLLEAARQLQAAGGSEWQFVFVIRGSGKALLQEEARGLENVLILDYVPADWTPDLLWSADVHLITMRPGWEGIVVPSKLYGVLKTNAPVLYVGPLDSGVAEEIRREHAGMALPPDAAGSDLVQSLRRLSAGPHSRRPQNGNGRAGQVAHFLVKVKKGRVG